MKKQVSSIIILAVILLNACGNANEVKPLSVGDIEPVQRQEEVDEAKELLMSMEEVLNVKGVQYTHLLFLAPEIKQFDRFKLEHVRQEAFKKVKQAYPDAKVHVSTDKKIYMELDKLEQQLIKKEISAEDPEKKLMKIEEDMKG